MRRPAFVLLCIAFLSNSLLAQSRPPQSAAATAAALHDDSSVESLVTGLGQAFRQLPSVESAVILGVGGGLSLAVHAEDEALTRRFRQSPALDTTFEAGEAFGGGTVQLGAAAAVYALGRGLHSPRAALLGADMIRGQIVNGALTQGIKLAVDRRRPDGTRYSFPSGHTSSSFATATVLQRHFGWRLGLPAYALAGFVGGSRLQENKHYMSDVVFGAAVGIVAGRATTIGRGRATFAVSPIAAPRGAAIAFSLVAAP